jgi:hypothetical protein
MVRGQWRENNGPRTTDNWLSQFHYSLYIHNALISQFHARNIYKPAIFVPQVHTLQGVQKSEKSGMLFAAQRPFGARFLLQHAFATELARATPLLRC